jgi:hypothetical protein
MDVRDKIQVIRTVITKYDEVSEQLADARFRMEMLRRRPELGTKQENGQLITVATAAAYQQGIQELEKERVTIGDILLYLAGKDSVDAAREAYLDLLGAFNRLGKLREESRLLAAGYTPMEIDLDGDQVETLPARMQQAQETLDRISAGVDTPAPSSVII